MLLLRGNDHAHKSSCIRLAESLGLKDVGVFFPPPVRETSLIAAAAAADVGVIPYMPTIINFRYCCPNKLSQYMQAGLPIMAGNTALRRPDPGRIGGRLVLRSGRSGIDRIDGPAPGGGRGPAPAVPAKRRAIRPRDVSLASAEPALYEAYALAGSLEGREEQRGSFVETETINVPTDPGTMYPWLTVEE